MSAPQKAGVSDLSEPEVVHAEGCQGFLVSADGSRIRLELSRSSGRSLLLELPAEGLFSLMKVMAEAQQRALPRGGGNDALRVIRQPVTWSLERDMADETLTLVFVTQDGFEWCFSLADSELFRMAECLREERTVTLPAPVGRQ